MSVPGASSGTMPGMSATPQHRGFTDFPDDPDLVTPAWLSDVLGVGEITALRHAAVGTGQMACSHRFEFVAGTEPGSVVGKFPSTDAATRELGARAYSREVCFYRDIGPGAGARVPACHHLDISDDAQRFVLILEDLAPAAPGNQIDGCGVDDAERAIINLARLHAATWQGRGIVDLPWLADDRSIPLSDYVALALPDFTQRFEGRVAPTTLEVFTAFAEQADSWAATHPATVAAVHGDYRLDNLLFHPTTGSVAAVDWQTVSLGNPGRDLAYFLGNSLETPDRRAHEQHLVDTYLRTLGEQGVSGYDAETCWGDLRHGAFQGPLVTMLGAFTAIRTERGEAMFTAMADRCAAQIVDHDAFASIG